MNEKKGINSGSVVVGIDVGGTFTDLILIDSREGPDRGVRVAKTPTTIENQAFGVVNAIRETEVPASEIGLIVHGTTTTTNAVLERQLARTGMITTRRLPRHYRAWAAHTATGLWHDRNLHPGGAAQSAARGG